MAPQLPAELHRLSGGSVCTAYIVDVNPNKNHYRVRIPGVSAPFAAIGGAPLASFSPGSGMGSQAYSVGSRVLLFLPPQWPQQPAVILGTLPTGQWSDLLTSPQLFYWFWPPLLTWDYREAVFGRSPFAGSLPGSIRTTTPGQQGVIFPSGVGYVADYFRVQLLGGSKASIEANLIDYLVRVCGFNYEVFTAGSVEKRIAEQGVYDETYLSTPFLWEAKVGALDTTSQQQGAVTVPRHVILRGYLGDIEREVIQAPNIYHNLGPGGSSVSGISEEAGYGLLEIRKGIDGSYYLWSAKEIELAKVSVMPALKRIRHEAHYRHNVSGENQFEDYYPAGVKFTSWQDMSDYYTYPPGDIDTREYYTKIYMSVDGGAVESYDEDTYGKLVVEGLIATLESLARTDEHDKTLFHHPACPGLSTGTPPASSSSCRMVQWCCNPGPASRRAR